MEDLGRRGAAESPEVDSQTDVGGMENVCAVSAEEDGFPGRGHR
jgi:hypothetical protein